MTPGNIILSRQYRIEIDIISLSLYLKILFFYLFADQQSDNCLIIPFYRKLGLIGTISVSDLCTWSLLRDQFKIRKQKAVDYHTLYSQGKFHFQTIISQGFSQTEDIKTRILRMSNKITMNIKMTSNNDTNTSIKLVVHVLSRLK